MSKRKRFSPEFKREAIELVAVQERAAGRWPWRWALLRTCSRAGFEKVLSRHGKPAR